MLPDEIESRLTEEEFLELAAFFRIKNEAEAKQAQPSSAPEKKHRYIGSKG